MNPKKKVSEKENKGNSVKKELTRNQIDKKQDSQSLTTSKIIATKLNNNTTNEKDLLTQKIQKLELSLRKRIEIDQVLKQKASDHKKDIITLEMLDLALQRPEIVYSIGRLVQEKQESNVATIPFVDPVTSQRKILRDKIREIVYTLNKLES